MEPDTLERLIGARLEALPPRPAPSTLLPRVMAAVRAAGLPWYRREWFAWPAAWQMLSSVSLVALVIGIGWLMPSVDAWATAELASASEPIVGPAAAVAARVEALMTAAQLVWDVVHPLAMVAAAALVMMSGACLAFGTALGRLAFGGPLRS